jgi:Holliday junction DNA helicase RuvB
MLSAPFRSRFGLHFRLDFYKAEDIEKIVNRSAKLLNIGLHPSAVTAIAKSSRFTPRVANRLLKRVRDYAQVHNVERIDDVIAATALKMLEVDDRGLEETDRKILSTIALQFDGGPVGLKSVAAAISEEEGTIEDVYEPYLIQIGFLNRTPKGRVITKDGLKHLGLAKDLSLDF